jgi:ABC-2 type transport system ATP-binding protein
VTGPGGAIADSAAGADRGRDTADGAAIANYGLTKSYGRTPALAGLDMAVPRGVVFGFLGPNGAGKTTTIRCLMGLIRPDGGSIELLGRPFTGRDRQRLTRIGSLIETPSFYPYLSGRDNLRVIATTGAITARQRVEEVLDLVGLRDRAADRVSSYSLGMRQRLGIAAALVSDPEVLVLDEPANGLDPAGIVAMRETLRFLATRGKTVLVSSHLLGEVQQLADMVGIIAKGRLIRQGALDTMLQESGHVRVRVEPEDEARARERLERLAGAEAVWVEAGPAQDNGWITVRVEPRRAGDVNRALAEAGVYATGLESGNDLESLFLSLTGAA